MTPELTALTLAALLQVFQFGLMSLSANLDLGPGKTLSPRDESRLGGTLSSQLSEKPARLYRAFNNHFEALLLFSIACLVITFSDQSSKGTALCSVVYLISRCLYIPAYYYGWTPWRSLIWLAGFLATVLMLLLALV